MQSKCSRNAESPAKPSLCPRTACTWDKLVFKNRCRVGENEIKNMSPGFNLQTYTQRIIEPESLLLEKIIFTCLTSKTQKIINNYSHPSVKFHPSAQTESKKVIHIHKRYKIPANVCWGYYQRQVITKFSGNNYLGSKTHSIAKFLKSCIGGNSI